jgi:hypothetical protein
MTEEELRLVFAMFIVNGLLSRRDPQDIDPDEIWLLTDGLLERRKKEITGLPPIKRKRKDSV